jgi:hypothetical protein
MPRYVILEHDWPEQHWDFMLEAGSVLETWRLPATPTQGVTILAEKSFDHRLMYLDYEGPISDGRGSVIQWDAGTYELSTGPSRVLNKGQDDYRNIRLEGKRIQGMVELSRESESGWNLQFSSEKEIGPAR